MISNQPITKRRSTFWGKVFFPILFLGIIYYWTASPQFNKTELEHTKQGTIDEIFSDFKYYLEQPIIITNCTVQAPIQFLGRSIYFLESIDSDKTLIVVSSNFPYQEGTEVEVLGIIRPILCIGKNFKMVLVKEAISREVPLVKN